MASSDSSLIPPRTFKNSAQHGSPRHLNTCIISDFHTWSFRFVYKVLPIYTSQMVIEHSFQRISLISNYIITNKTLILYFVNSDCHIFQPKNARHVVVGKIKMNTVFISQTWVLDTTTSTTETQLINSI